MEPLGERHVIHMYRYSRHEQVYMGQLGKHCVFYMYGIASIKEEDLRR